MEVPLYLNHGHLNHFGLVQSTHTVYAVKILKIGTCMSEQTV